MNAGLDTRSPSSDAASRLETRCFKPDGAVAKRRASNFHSRNNPSGNSLAPAHRHKPNAQVSARLHLSSLGKARLELNGTPVQLELDRALEVLVCLLRMQQTHPEGFSVQHILRDLIPDVPQRQGQLYVHQVRYELEKKISGLSVPYNATNRTYALQSDLEITWDVLEFEAALAEQSPVRITRAFKLYGALMPNAEGEWFEHERNALNAHALKSGLEWCKTWFEPQQYGRCVQLATR